MATFSIRLVQQITEQGSGDSVIEASSAEAAAGILLAAYKAAQAEDSSVVELLDGQVQLIERAEVLGRSVSFKLLDEDGAKVRLVTAPDGRDS